MKKQKKRKQKRKKSSKLSSVNYSKSNMQAASVFPLEILAEKRSGGAESIKGFVFQCQYAAWKILKHLDPSRASQDKFIRLEGIEDIDVFNVSTDGDVNEFIQVKSSRNRMDAGTFWGKHRIFQNFVEVYINNPKSRFRLVHDMPFSEGHLSALNQFSTNGNPLSEKDLKY